jgi:hypothetical protein
MAYYVEVIQIDRVFGGREEGGWWYDWNTVVFQRKTNKRRAIKLAKQIAEAEAKGDGWCHGEIELVLPRRGDCRNHGSCKRCEKPVIVRQAYRGRNRFSVLGGADYVIRVSKRPTVNTTRRERYE